jgi:hypothetical protein
MNTVLIIVALLATCLLVSGCKPDQIREVESIEKAAIIVEEDVAKSETDVCLKCWDNK